MSSYDALGDAVGEMSEFVGRIEGSVQPTTREVEVSSGTGSGSSENATFTTRWMEANTLLRFLSSNPETGTRTAYSRVACPLCGSFPGRELPWMDRYRGVRTTEFQSMGVAANLTFEGDAERTMGFPASESGPVIVGRRGVMAGGGIPARRYAEEQAPGYHNIYPRLGWEPISIIADEPDPLAFYYLGLMYGGSEYRPHRTVVGHVGNPARHFSFARGQMVGRHGSGIAEGVPSG